MSCFFTPVVDESLSSCFTEDARFLAEPNTDKEQGLYDKYFEEQINLYGTEVEYMQNNYQLSAHDSLYGEHTTKVFSDPETLVMFVVFNSDSIVLNQFGIESDGDITAFVHISSFESQFGLSSEPHMGDLIRLTEYGNRDRPNGRGPAVFEITRRDDEDLMQINPLLGHYVWLLRGKRYDYSYERNVTPENLINQINDDVPQSQGLTSDPGGLSSIADKVDKTYDSSSDERGVDIFDYDSNTKSRDSVYGDY